VEANELNTTFGDTRNGVWEELPAVEELLE
jgi:hypothetical protein